MIQAVQPALKGLGAASAWERLVTPCVPGRPQGADWRRTLDVAQRALGDKQRLEQELLDARQRLHSQDVMGPGLSELKGAPPPGPGLHQLLGSCASLPWLPLLWQRTPGVHDGKGQGCPKCCLGLMDGARAGLAEEALATLESQGAELDDVKVELATALRQQQDTQVRLRLVACRTDAAATPPACRLSDCTTHPACPGTCLHSKAVDVSRKLRAGECGS